MQTSRTKGTGAPTEIINISLYGLIDAEVTKVTWQRQHWVGLNESELFSMQETSPSVQEPIGSLG